MIDKINNEWLQMYECAKQYFIKHGNLIVFINATDDETRKLYIWLSNQRLKYKSNALNQKKIELLEMLNINWNVYDYDVVSDFYRGCNLIVPEIPEISEIVDSINKNPDISVAWLRMYECAKRFYLQYGNLAVPSVNNFQYNTGKNGEKLSNWILTQRQNRKLSRKQITLLEDIGMIWNVREYQRKKFWNRYQEPIELVIADIPKSDAINNETNDHDWSLMYEVAKQYYLYYGHLDIPSPSNSSYYLGENGEKLWKWLFQQKQKYRNKTLSNEKIKLLEEIGIVWNNQHRNEVRRWRRF